MDARGGVIHRALLLKAYSQFLEGLRLGLGSGGLRV